LKAVEHQGLRYYQSEMWTHLKHGIFTRHGGVSPAPWASLNLGGTVGDEPLAVRQNHERIYAALGVNSSRTVTTWQVHSADVVVAMNPVRGRRWLAQADGLITDRPDTPLTMRYADCTPLLFHDPVKGVIGIAHAGWRGTVLGMAANMVRAMQQTYGSRPVDIQALIGPSISRACFQVGEEVVKALYDYLGTLDGLMERDPADGTAYVDLWEANRRDLQRMGVEHIETAGLCTVKRSDEFFSHRGEKGRTGRFGAVISL
jgi:polyphenol oxidase